MTQTSAIPPHEDLRIEFKSDVRRLRDDDLVQAAVCLANTEGGVIYLGIEKDGTVTGLNAAHRDLTGLAALIANRTAPPLSVRVDQMMVQGTPVGVIEVPRSLRLTATSTVVVELSCEEADLDFLKLVLEEEQRIGMPMPVDSLLVLSTLRQQRRADTAEIARVLQKSPQAARAVLERLLEAGLLQAHGIKKGRTYTLSPSVYRRMGGAADSVRQAGFEALQQEQLVLRYVDQHGTIRRGDVMTLCSLGPDQASRLLKGLVDKGMLVRRGTRRGAYYERA